MFISENVIYFELQKTGCSHTLNILNTLIPDGKIIGKHNVYSSVSKSDLGDFRNKIKIGNIRNPWDWYVSLWSFGCLHEGGLYGRVTRKPNLFKFNQFRHIINGSCFKYNIDLWKKLYSDSSNIDNFKKWLTLILLEQDYSIFEGYTESKISKKIGLLSYRYIKLYTKKGKNDLVKINSYSDLIHYDNQHNFINLFIKNESIHHDFINNSELFGISSKNMRIVLEGFNIRTNSSIRGDYRNYYDDELVDLVYKKEKFILDKFNYSF